MLARYFLPAIALACLAVAEPAGADELMSKAQALFKPIPSTPPALPNNPSTPAKIELGKMLYMDRRLSESHNISCNSCHDLGLAGSDVQETSIGHNWQRGGRHAPTVFNAVFDVAQFWDGRAKDLQEQAGGPMQNPIEMAGSRQLVLNMLKGIPGYAPLFKKAFPDAADPITFENATKAIAVFEATLITPDAPFDKFLKGDAKALDDRQKKGLALFIDKGCTSCHSGINIGGGMYAPFGVVEKLGADLLPPGDKGRFEVTKSADDQYVFKVPSLRNVAVTAPYFHTGRVWDLRQAVGIMGAAQLGIKLSDAEIDQIVAFLDTLTGEQPQIAYPQLPPSVAATPRPGK
jgi:cytochrome c peroxidase